VVPGAVFFVPLSPQIAAIETLIERGRLWAAVERVTGALQ
jgi:hypothetical protein